MSFIQFYTIANAVGNEIPSNSSVNTIATTITADKQALVNQLIEYGITGYTSSTTLITLINSLSGIQGAIRNRNVSETLGSLAYLETLLPSDSISESLLFTPDDSNMSETLGSLAYLETLLPSDSIKLVTLT
jgi:hypothetical protein